MNTTQEHELQQQALRAFEQDLPALLTEHAGQWVAYQGVRQLGFAARKHELYQRCYQQGLRREEFVIFCIEPQETEMRFGPVVQD